VTWLRPPSAELLRRRVSRSGSSLRLSQQLGQTRGTLPQTAVFEISEQSSAA
jgi:hypothetical protein